jgi:citrate synthase
MAMLVSTVAALSAVYPEAKEVHNPANRLHQIKRLIGKMPTIAAMSYAIASDSPMFTLTTI